jgi:hypothetical protein
MGFVFYVLGVITVAAGIFWAFTVLAVPVSEDTNGLAIFGRLIIAAPGLGVVFGGLLLLAIGSALNKLERIARNTEPNRVGGR